MQPKRNEIWKVDFGLAGKVRPAVVVSISLGENDRKLFCVVPHTTSLKGSQFEIIVPVGYLESGAFLVQSVASFPLNRFGNRMGTLSEAQMHLVEQGLRLLFAL